MMYYPQPFLMVGMNRWKGEVRLLILSPEIIVSMT